MALFNHSTNTRSGRAVQNILTLTIGASSLFWGGCGFAIKEGAQHAHVLAASQVEMHTAFQFDMLPEVLHAEACASPRTLYDVTVLGTEKSLSRGERAAVLEALNAVGTQADIFYLTRSVGTLMGETSCGEVWGRGLRLRAHDFSPGVAAATGTSRTETSSIVPAPAAATTSPADKSKMGF